MTCFANIFMTMLLYLHCAIHCHQSVFLQNCYVIFVCISDDLLARYLMRKDILKARVFTLINKEYMNITTDCSFCLVMRTTPLQQFKYTKSLGMTCSALYQLFIFNLKSAIYLFVHHL